MNINFNFDESLIEDIAARFDLRAPNKAALAALVKSIASNEQAPQGVSEYVADLATGVGKTYLMAALIDYAAYQGVKHILIVTPGSTIQEKTLANFDQASKKYVPGADHLPLIITPENFRSASVGTVLHDPTKLKVFVFNVQQLIRPTQKASRRTRDIDENIGSGLYQHLTDAPDLLVIADEFHTYRHQAKSFSAALRDLSPFVLVGLTATPEPADYKNVVFQYTLGEAIADEYVKTPVIVYREDGTKDERTQLLDACHLLKVKEKLYETYCEGRTQDNQVRPALFVVCESIEHASKVGQTLASEEFIGNPSEVLEITSESSDVALQALEDVESPSSPIRAIVSVNKLKEGWDVKNISVIVALRKLASETLTEQILGRGLRLPFGSLTGVPGIDQVDLVAHDSYRQLLAQKDILVQRIQAPATEVPVDASGAAVTPALTRSLIEDVLEPNNTPDTISSRTPVNQTPNPVDVAGSLPDTEILVFREQGTPVDAEVPTPYFKVDDAPTIRFPLWEKKTEPSIFTFSRVSNDEAFLAGRQFSVDTPSIIARDAVIAERVGQDVTVTIRQAETATAAPTLFPVDDIVAELTTAVLRLREVPRDVSAVNGVQRVVKSFLEGAGVTGENTNKFPWSPTRSMQARDGIRKFVTEKIQAMPSTVKHSFRLVEIPVEPEAVKESEVRNFNPHDSASHTWLNGWANSIMPIARFDAETTEWEIAKILNRDTQVKWWQRIYTNGPAHIPTESGRYFPDFIVIDSEDVLWVVEGKSDTHARTDEVQTKKQAAEMWAREVRDAGTYGTWRYLFVTESDIARSGRSWQGLVSQCRPEM